MQENIGSFNSNDKIKIDSSEIQHSEAKRVKDLSRKKQFSLENTWKMKDAFTEANLWKHNLKQICFKVSELLYKFNSAKNSDIFLLSSPYL